MKTDWIFRIVVLAASVLAAVPLLHAVEPQQAVDAFVRHPMMRHASVGVAVMDLDAGAVVASHSLDQAVVTASTMKVVTSVAALESLGGGFRFVTPVTAVGSLSADSTVLLGNVVVTGAGDPTLGSAYLAGEGDIVRQTVEALRSRGIKRVAGCVLTDERLFDNVPPYSIHWDVGDLAWDYGACVYALNYADNLTRLEFTADKWGRMTESPVLRPDVPCAQVISALRGGNITEIDYALEYGSPAVVLRGTVTSGRHSRTVANPHPACTLADSITHSLRRAGIAVDGDSLVLTRAPYRQPVDTLVAHRSAPLTDIVRSLLDRSDNMYAHALLRAIAVRDAGWRGHTDPDDYGVECVRRVLRRLGVDTDALFMRDGSGLARAGKASPGLFMELLSAVAERNYAGMRLCELLPAAGKRVGRRLPSTSLARDVVLKSGSMTDVQCFVGYYPAARPRYAFAVLVNNYRAPRSELKNHIDVLLINLFGRRK